MYIDRHIQYFRGHITFSANPVGVWGDVHVVCQWVMFDGQSQISNTTGQVTLHKDVFTLEIAVSYSWLAYTHIQQQNNTVFDIIKYAPQSESGLFFG
jgi:hypothetical protein